MPAENPFTIADDLELALSLSESADALTMRRFGAVDLRVDDKPDLTPVSDADLACEALVRERLAAMRPGDEILGEEFGGDAVLSGRQWVIDPIDGTKNFVRGVPVWATLIALLDDGKPVLGCVSAPALDRRWWASTGNGAWAGKSLAKATRIGVSGVRRLADASLSYSDLVGWDHLPTGVGAALRLIEACWRTRAYGDFWSYMLLAEGAVDVACEPDLALHDLAALIPIIVEAGGRVTSLEGVEQTAAGSFLATNGLLHDEVLALVNAPRSAGAHSPA
ncbi:MAG: inositol monophosphatase family protein [Gordonia amarae]